LAIIACTLDFGDCDQDAVGFEGDVNGIGNTLRRRSLAILDSAQMSEVDMRTAAELPQ
jgi:hypothetical protein